MNYEIDLSVIIVSYNVKDYLKKCLISIDQHAGDIQHEILIVDNHSHDDSCNMINNEFPHVQLFSLNENIGFAAANNVALQKCKGKFILFLNPDTVLREKSLHILMDYLTKNNKCGIIGPKLLNKDGTIQNGLRQFPTLLMALSRHTLLKYIPYCKYIIKKYHMRHFNLNQNASVDQVSGAAMMIRHDIFKKTGLFDEQFFIFFEEVDYCRRIKNMELDVYYNTNATIYHFGGKSRDQVNFNAIYFHLESMLKYLKKHNPKTVFILFIFIFKLLYLLSSGIEMFLDLFFWILFLMISPFIKKSKQTTLNTGCRFKTSKKFIHRLQKAQFRLFFVKNKIFHFIFNVP